MLFLKTLKHFKPIVLFCSIIFNLLMSFVMLNWIVHFFSSLKLFSTHYCHVFASKQKQKLFKDIASVTDDAESGPVGF